MNIEIERKFLVKNNDFKTEAQHKSFLKQGFLNSHKERTVRVRILDNKSFLTIKGKSNNSGISRLEWEIEIPLKEGKKLLSLSEKGIIEKYRYYIKKEKYTFEVDEFLGDNKGLIIAEIELNNENDTFEKPNWLGKEVTGQKKYYNSFLSQNPYKNW